MSFINVNKQKIIFAIIIGLLVVAGLWFLAAQRNRPAGTSLGGFDVNRPFANVTIPSEFDEATRAVVQGKIDATKAMYEESPNIWEAWIAIGNLRSLLNDPEGAIAAYRQSLVLQSNNILAYRNMAEVYRNELKDYKKAVEFYRLAIDNNFADPDPYIALALILQHQLKDADGAEKVYLEGLAKTNNQSDIMVRTIKFYQSIGETKKYEEMARQLLELYPKNEGYKREWGKLVN